MFTSIRIKGLGAHIDQTLALSPNGITEIEGASASGKTSLIEAVCFVLWGLDRFGKAFPIEAIRDDVVEVDLVTVKGSTLRRTMRRNRTQTRLMIKADGTETAYPTEDAWRVAIGGLARNIPALRHVLVPDAWVDLAHGEGGGRPLRDLMASLTTGGGLRDVVERLMVAKGHAMLDTDPVVEKEAAELRKNANSRRDERKGSVDADGRRVEQLMNAPAPTSALTEGDVARFEQGLKDADEWSRHDRRIAKAKDQARAVELDRERHADWTTRKAALGERPEAPVSGQTIATGKALQEATALVRQLETDRATATANAGTAEHLLKEAERAEDPEVAKQTKALEGYRHALQVAEASGDTCSHCKRPGWAEAAQALDAARLTVKSAEAYLEAIQKPEAVEQRREVRLVPFRSKVEAAKKKIEGFAPKIEAAKVAEEEARKANVAATNKRAAVDAYDKQLAALGKEPTIGELPAAVVPPTSDRPDAAAIARMTKALDEHKAAEGAIAERERLIEAAKATLMEAETRLATAKAEAARCDALVAAVRAAPSEIAREQLALLGDIKPLALQMKDDGSVVVEVDGRSWWRASTGRQIVADATFRQGLRRAINAGLKAPIAFPIFVDEVQSVGGCELRIEGPAVLLRTTDDAKISVRAASKVAA